MQLTTKDFLDSFKSAYHVSSTPKITVEWNLNRFVTVESLKNNGTAVEKEKDDPISPLWSLLAPRRPDKQGIVKGFVGPGREAFAYSALGSPKRKRTYVASEDSKYKYWVSDSKSSAVAVGSERYQISGVSPEVIYEYRVPTNKLRIQFEGTLATPKSVYISYTTDKTTWRQVGGSYAPDEFGTISLYLQNDGSWSQTLNTKNKIEIYGIKVVVSEMSAPNTHCHMIEMAAMRCIDVTDRTISYSINNEISEVSSVAPVGRCSSSTGSLVLSNHDGVLDNDRAYTDLAGMMASPAKVTIDMEVGAGNSLAYARQAVMYVDSWGEQTEDTRQLSLTDGSLFLKEEKPAPLLFEDVTATEAVWRVLDSVGFSNYDITENPSGDATIQYYWTDPEATIWEHFQLIAEAMQIAIYFDESGMLRIKAREGIFKKELPTVWTLDGQKVTTAIATEEGRAGDVGKLPDIISISKPSELDANTVNISYTKTEVSSINKFQPAMEPVWQPEGSVVLRSASLVTDIGPDDTSAKFAGSNFATWPFEGLMDLEGEIVRWTKKRYRYVNSDGTFSAKFISSDDEKKKLDDENPRKAHKNAYTGELYFGNNRGIYSTMRRSHRPQNNFYRISTHHGNTTPMNQSGWYTFFQQEKSVFRIRTTNKFKHDSWTCALRGLVDDVPPMYFGTSLKFDNTSAYKGGAAGFFLPTGNDDEGYYIELNLTSNVGTRAITNELTMYQRKADGTKVRLTDGAVAGVSKGKWFDIDVFRMKTGDRSERYSIMLNGINALTVDVDDATAKNFSRGPDGRWGIFARGNTHVEFDYVYVANSTEVVPMDDSTRQDLISGGLRSDYYNKYLYRNNISERITSWSKRRMTLNSGFAFDDFGVDGHELREFNVKFDPSPVIHSRLYFSNKWLADCIEYVGRHDGAHFIMQNKARVNAVLNGEDSLLYGSENTVNQVMMIYGRSVKREDSKKHTVKNENSINRVGAVELDIDSPWIQSESAAKKIGDWIVEHWADGSESVSVTSFGNPFVQLGDVVGISYRRKSMKAHTHRYYVVGINHKYENGLETEFTLQKVSA